MSKQSGIERIRSFRNRTLALSRQFCATNLAIVGLLAIAIPSIPASAASNKFELCVLELDRANVPPEQAIKACAEAFVPEDLSECVLRIDLQTPTSGSDALEACKKVRRPVELARCVITINNRTQNPEVFSVLDHCRRSLLPLRFSECVIGLSSQSDFSTARTLETCIAAEDFPSQLFPPSSPNPSSPRLEFTPDTIPAPEIPLNSDS
ncbi:MAG: hypothetical protein F6K36_23920 [Symploca sp. SIO3C6]|uniref:Uncharacterized protein n=1 Tax=Symploca sp. SIO1C4 TaxID=2607765 RepID=A0A6B3NPB2_9CYAN|nr:hypothetical protein [Symploca sp. SIO3C6]NER31361.1 hypothetical protein [Symploca sp. SIO1C4]NET05968.1 hypothetical protein [Symploca sp. SIO2B6]